MQVQVRNSLLSLTEKYENYLADLELGGPARVGVAAQRRREQIRECLQIHFALCV
jgi:hypothetical protein